MTEHVARLDLWADASTPLDRLGGIEDEVDEALREGSIAAARTFLERVRRDNPGWATKHWGAPREQNGAVTVESDDEIAYYYWSGTKKHPIVARFAKALAFGWPGAPAIKGQPSKSGKHVFRGVMHPGTKAHPYVEAAGTAALPAMRDDYEEALGKVFDG